MRSPEEVPELIRGTLTSAFIGNRTINVIKTCTSLPDITIIHDIVKKKTWTYFKYVYKSVAHLGLKSNIL